ncbi:MAG: cation:proton antiporter [Candidatus Micrarchaeota archaeon]|nr:cation:proton antiporter [Candidatus Micrarchaeota archaeon]
MAGGEEIIGALGLLIFVGLASRFFLKKTGLSDIFVLMLAGIIAGFFVSASDLSALSFLALPFASITLFMIILGEGLNLSLEHAKFAHKALFFGGLNFFVSFLAISALGYFAFKLEPFVALALAAIYSGVAPEILSGVLSGLNAGRETTAIGELEAVFADALSIMFAFLFISAAIGSHTFSFGAIDFVIAILLSVALGALFAAFWRFFFFKAESENQHLLVIGLAAILYVISAFFGANSVISVFTFAFLLGTLTHPSIEEMRRFQFEFSFFLRTFFFLYLGMLVLHSPKPVELAVFAVAISFLVAFLRLAIGKALLKLSVSAKEERILEYVSGRGLTCAVLSIIAYEKLSRYLVPVPDLPLLSLFVIFFTNSITAFLLLKKRKH